MTNVLGRKVNVHRVHVGLESEIEICPHLGSFYILTFHIHLIIRTQYVLIQFLEKKVEKV